MRRLLLHAKCHRHFFTTNTHCCWFVQKIGKIWWASNDLKCDCRCIHSQDYLQRSDKAQTKTTKMSCLITKLFWTKTFCLGFPSPSDCKTTDYIFIEDSSNAKTIRAFYWGRERKIMWVIHLFIFLFVVCDSHLLWYIFHIMCLMWLR